MHEEYMFMPRMRVGWLNINLPGRQLMCIFVELYNGMLDLVPFTPLEEVTEYLSTSLRSTQTW